MQARDKEIKAAKCGLLGKWLLRFGEERESGGG